MPTVVPVCRRGTDEGPTRGDLFLEMERSPGVERVSGGAGGGGRALVGEGDEVGDRGRDCGVFMGPQSSSSSSSSSGSLFLFSPLAGDESSSVDKMATTTTVRTG